MKHRAYYQASINDFLQESSTSILGKLSQNHLNRSLEDLQRNTWQKQIEILKKQLNNLVGYIFFEFSIPRRGKRVDNIIIVGNAIFVVEFKIGTKSYEKHAINQVIDYCLDLKNFHQGSHNATLIPILIAENAPCCTPINFESVKEFKTAIQINKTKLNQVLKQHPVSSFPYLNPMDWANSPYHPTPTIVEAAQALYQGHQVNDITRSDAGAYHLKLTNQALNKIIEHSKKNQQKSICFVTGVPGAGKTLAGLNITNQRMNVDEDEHAVFLSGNGPLVNVLREALIRDAIANTPKLTRNAARPKVEAFIQNIHHFRDEYLKNQSAPIEKVVIFDEAQRAWNESKASQFMKEKRGLEDFNQSEPHFLIDIMNRHQGWSVIICLIGGGQEINTGEAGLSEWILALKTHFKNWQVYYSDYLNTQPEYLDQTELINWLTQYGKSEKNLHLATSVRSFRSEQLSNFINALLNQNIDLSKKLLTAIKDNYPIVLTRDLNKAKQWLKSQAKGSERYGLLVSSGARRLKAFGVDCKNELNEANWFLNSNDDVRSSYFLEYVATEFSVQGLELDYACVAWDANFYIKNNTWHYQNFKGNKWQKINQTYNQNYLLNAYRVLLTRARQGMVIWLPESDEFDNTRKPEYYDGTYQYLKTLGICEI